MQEQELFIGKTDKESVLQSKNAHLLTNTAKKKHLFEANLDDARILLQNALESNPYFMPAWLVLAEVDNDLGSKESSNNIFNYVHSLTKDIKRWRWEKTLTAYQLGRFELLPGELQYIIEEIPGKIRNDALQLAFATWPNTGELIENIGVPNINHLFKYAVKIKNTEHSLYYWSVIEEQSIEFKKQDLLSFIDMLMGNDEVAIARDLWRKYINPTEIFFNGDFERPIMQKAFGWRKIKLQSVTQTFEKISQKSNKNTLHLRFKGWDNIDFYHLYQIIPIRSGEIYRLAMEYKSNKLTTDQRPHIEIYGYKCNNQPHKKSEMFEPTQDWISVNLEFGVVQNCSAVAVRIRRNKSRHIDNKISGHLYLRNITISPIGEEYLFVDEDEI